MDQARKLRERALDAYRARYALLSADEIRSVRDRHRLTQAQLARLLRLGSNTISRWNPAETSRPPPWTCCFASSKTSQRAFRT